MYSYDNDGFGAFLGASIFIYILLFALCIFIICFIAKKMCEVAELKGVRVRRFQPHLSPVEIAKNKFN